MIIMNLSIRQTILTPHSHTPHSTKAKMKLSEDEKAKNHRAGGEGFNSRAHGIPDGTRYNQLHGSWTILRKDENERRAINEIVLLII